MLSYESTSLLLTLLWIISAAGYKQCLLRNKNLAELLAGAGRPEKCPKRHSTPWPSMGCKPSATGNKKPPSRPL